MRLAAAICQGQNARLRLPDGQERGCVRPGCPGWTARDAWWCASWVLEPHRRPRGSSPRPPNVTAVRQLPQPRSAAGRAPRARTDSWGEPGPRAPGGGRDPTSLPVPNSHVCTRHAPRIARDSPGMRGQLLPACARTSGSGAGGGADARRGCERSAGGGNRGPTYARRTRLPPPVAHRLTVLPRRTHTAHGPGRESGRGTRRARSLLNCRSRHRQKDSQQTLARPMDLAASPAAVARLAVPYNADQRTSVQHRFVPLGPGPGATKSLNLFHPG